MEEEKKGKGREREREKEKETVIKTKTHRHLFFKFINFLMITNFDHTSKLSNKFLPAHQSPLPHHTQSQKISNILLLYDDGIEAIRYSFHSHSCQTLTSSHHALPFPYNKSPRMMQFLEVDKNHRLIFLITLSLFVH